MNDMELLARYIHGSGDSTDTDVVYVVDELPSPDDCKKFCSADSEENRNLIVVRNSVVVECYKGTPDEINNSLLRTYSLHEQGDALVVERIVERVVPIKIVRAVRIILSHLSRSSMRPMIKSALRGSWNERLSALKEVIAHFNEIDFSVLNKNMSREDILKVIAFQTGQTLALLNETELYTKAEITEEYCVLKQFLYRSDNSDVAELADMLKKLLAEIEKLKVERPETTVPIFSDYRYSVDLLSEEYTKID